MDLVPSAEKFHVVAIGPGSGEDSSILACTVCVEQELYPGLHLVTTRASDSQT